MENDATLRFTMTTLGNSTILSAGLETAIMQSVPTQNLSVVQGSNGVSVSDYIRSMAINPSTGAHEMQWSSLTPQNTIITLHTLPFVEGGQEIAITDTNVGNVLNISAESASLVQTLISPAVNVKNEEKSHSGEEVELGGQLVNFASTAATQSVGQTVAAACLHMTSNSPLTAVQVGSAGILTAESVEEGHSTIIPDAELSDETPIFTRVCAKLNAAVMNIVPESQDVLLEQLGTEENVQLGIDDQRCFTLEASLSTVVRVHNRLKDLLNLPQYTRLQFSTEQVTALSTSQPQQKKTSDKSTSCRLLIPFVSSKGRQIKVPANLPGVLNSRDAFASDDEAENDIKMPKRKRKGKPRKMAKSNEEEDILSSKTEKNEVGESRFLKNSNEDIHAGEIEFENRMDDIKDSSSSLSVIRKSRRKKHESKATQQRRIYEGRIPFKFFCKTCSFKSKRESHYLKHLKCHDMPGTELHQCEECSFTTIRLSHLRRHELLHKKSLVRCDYCDYVTDSRQQLQKHAKMKHPNGNASSPSQQHQLYKCNVCGLTSGSQKYFTRHVLKHAQESSNGPVAGHDAFKCTQCTRTFQQRVHYERHCRDVHGPEVRPHLCDVCGKAFKRTDALQQHKVVHMSQDTRTYHFHCPQCNKGCRSQAHLKEHLTKHASDRPFLCQYCGSAFKTQSVQRKHILSLHLKPGAFSCDICGKKFNTGYGLQRHSRTHETDIEKFPAAINTVSSDNLVDLAMTETEQLGQDDSDAVAAADDAAEVLQTQQPALVQDVMTAGMEEALEQEEELQAQYIQSTETASALFYLTGSLQSL
ncbi:zinc finger protein 286A-like isoform X2 [Pomacea canaliculata]|uniref:zinc finger protein 286A-like isoform X2 n=1 Tax=Pomacea canaliculata TaxID=400727 RepID=UPI000D73E240|nr:zinc finger protein 286A-like isoform X2 [Pomacea canaliculata]